MEFENILLQEGVDPQVVEFVREMESSMESEFKNYEDIADYCQVKILRAMQESKLASTDFNWTTGYGYGDPGREKVEEIYSSIFKSEDALVRPNIVSGTHAISLVLFSILRGGDHFLSITGTPYDTLLKVIGTKGNSDGSLIDLGVEYSEIPLVNGSIDLKSIVDYIKPSTKMVEIQRSTGYSDRRAFTISEIKEAIEEVKSINKDIIVFVDNCYGEFTEYLEPVEIGADIVAGSLIKNPGGGLAYSGGYICGREDLINKVASRLTAPGIGKDCGLTFGITRQILQGLFLSPSTVLGARKGALFSACFEKLGFKCIPSVEDPRSDIIQSIEFKDPELLKIFCREVQFASPVDSYFTPEPWDMPGYTDKVIMAAGGFIEGSSIELSADGPMREPYTVYFQGGLTYSHCKIALVKILDKMKKSGLIKITP